MRTGDWNSSSWVGIDGFNVDIVSNDVVQIGVDQSVSATGEESYVAWFEWYAPDLPDSPPYIWQTNFEDFPVNPGDSLSGLVILFQGEFFGVLPLAVVFLQNETTNLSRMLTLFPPPGATASGNTVEWVMECNDGGEPFNSLPTFTPVVFTSALAVDADGNVGDPVNGDICNVADPVTGQVLTSVEVGSETVTITFIG